MVHTAATKVLRTPMYILLAILVSSFALWAVILIPHAALLEDMFLSPALSWGDKFSFVLNLFSITHGNFTVFSFSYTVVIALLLGLNVTWLTFYIMRARVGVRRFSGSGWQIGGLVSGVLGMGCAACGVAVLAAILQLIGAAWIITYMPLHGAEFALLAIVILSYSLWRLSQRILDPLVCVVE